MNSTIQAAFVAAKCISFALVQVMQVIHLFMTLLYELEKDQTEPFVVLNASVYWPECSSSVILNQNVTRNLDAPALVTVLLTRHYAVCIYDVQCFSQQKLVRLKSAPGRFNISLQR